MNKIITTETVVVELEKMSCAKCGGTHKGGCHCPYCETRWSWGESDAERLRKQLDQKERELRESKCEVLKRQQLLDSEKQARALIEKKLNRTRNGVYPCCNRTFSNLARHMKTKHSKTA